MTRRLCQGFKCAELLRTCNDRDMPTPLKNKARTPKPPAKPKPSAKPKKAPITEHMARMAEGPMPDDFGTQLSTYMAHLGRKGGKISGAQRIENPTERRRMLIAEKAAAVRWAKKKRPVTS
jgi:hypothetical protein